MGFGNRLAVESYGTTGHSMEEKHLIGDFSGLVPDMCDHEREQSGFVNGGPECGEERIFNSIVQKGGWLVENQHVTVDGLDSRKHYSLRLAAAQRARGCVALENIREAERFNRMFNPVFLECPAEGF